MRVALIMFCNLHELMNSLPCFLCCTLLFKCNDLAGTVGIGFTTAGLAIPRSVCALPTFTQPSQERGLCASSARIDFQLDCYCIVVHKRWVKAGERAKGAQRPGAALLSSQCGKTSTFCFSSDYNKLVIAIA